MKLYKLGDERWKEVLEKVIQRDNYKCVSCGGKWETVHFHVYYEDPWDAPLDELSAICKVCSANIKAAVYLVRSNPGMIFLPHIIKRLVILNEKGSSSRSWIFTIS